MAPNYSVKCEDGVVIATFSAQPEESDLRRCIDKVAGHTPNDLRLFDISVGVNLTPADVRELAAYVKSIDWPPSRVAIVAPQDLEFGLSRMYEAFREDHVTKLKVFRGRREALDWLKGRSAG